ncbi:MAG: carbohydrate ABC transporter permease, partial [Lacrimispora sphenoides]
MKTGYRERRIATTVVYHVFTFLLACVMIYPLVWMVMSSFKNSNEIFRTAAKLLPDKFSLENYRVGWQGFAGYGFSTFFKNSFI